MLTVLIATADRALAATLEAELGALGLDTREAVTGLDALEGAPCADAVFLDVNLPIFDGLTVAARLRDDPDVPPELPIVLITGQDTNPHEVEAAGVKFQLKRIHAAQDLRELIGRALFGA
jgi:CheY-like chemotaxis protein